jgi:hypothetical protein
LLEENESILHLEVKIFKEKSILVKVLEISILDYMKDRVVENVSCLGDESEIEIKYIFKDYKKLTDSQYLEFDSSMIRKEKGFLDQLVENENKHIKNSENLNNSSELPKAKYHKIMNKISSPIVIDINDKNKLENAQM